MEDDMEAIIRRAGEGTATWFLNGLMTTKASAAETAGGYALMEHVLTAACNSPVHVHNGEDEAFYVLDGEIEFDVGGDVALATAGTYVLAPRGVAHSFRVLTDSARALVITSSSAPAPGSGFHNFARAAGVPATARTLPMPAAPDPRALAVLAAAHDIDILGPPAP
jgi:quercetin dioxygenase-like cupin family protein